MKFGEWTEKFICDTCNHVSKYTYPIDVCPSCGDKKLVNNVGQVGWKRKIMRYVSTGIWYKPNTWGKGHWEERTKVHIGKELDRIMY